MSKVIDNYLVKQIIGKGSYGNVHLAKHLKTKELVAIKVISKQTFQKEPILNKLIKNEIVSLKNIEHENIIKFIEIMRSTNNTYFVYEYCNGGNLLSLLEKKKFLKEKQAIVYFKQVLEAFKVLVQKNIIHRDIKIENILLHDDKIKVADFGFCQKLELNSFAYKRLGSPLFMAPEILRQMPYDGRCDIYSLGCLLYNLLYGKNPYHETDINRLMMKIQLNKWSFPQGINDVSKKTKDLIRLCLINDVNKRITWQQLFDFNFSYILGDEEEPKTNAS